MTTITRSGVFEGRKAYLKEPRIGSSLCVTDFLSVRDRRIAQIDESPRARENELAMLRAASQRRNRAEVLGPLERFAYSLISAAALTVVSGWDCKPGRFLSEGCWLCPFSSGGQ